MSVLNLMICAHGHLYKNEDDYIDTFTSNNTNVVTWASPTVGCIYPPGMLKKLRETITDQINSYRNNSPEINNLKTFYKIINKSEKQIGMPTYCSEDWNEYFAKERSYDPKKSCGIQINNIQDKLFLFQDDDTTLPDNLFGVWNLKTGENYIPYFKTDPELRHGTKQYYKFSVIINTLRKQFDNIPINILDSSCSVIYNKDGKRITNKNELDRYQRRLGRNVFNTNQGLSQQSHNTNQPLPGRFSSPGATQGPFSKPGGGKRKNKSKKRKNTAL